MIILYCRASGFWLVELKKEIESIKCGKGFMRLIFDLTKKQEQIAKIPQGNSGKKFELILTPEIDR